MATKELIAYTLAILGILSAVVLYYRAKRKEYNTSPQAIQLELLRVGFKGDLDYTPVLERLTIETSHKSLEIREYHVYYEGDFYFFDSYKVGGNKLSFYAKEEVVFFVYGGVKSLYY